jgi:hypothetical protein
MILEATGGPISVFMAYIESNIACEIDRITGWSGKFWEERFSATPILDDESLMERIRYILMHGVKEGLVARSADWPGLTCIPEFLGKGERSFPWIDRTGYSRARHRGEDVRLSDFTKRYNIKIVSPPSWRDLDASICRAKAKELLKSAEEQARNMWGSRPVLGVEKVKSQDPIKRPLRFKRGPRPLCHAGTRKVRDAYREKYRDFVRAYKQASELFRRGFYDTEFPLYCYKPPLSRFLNGVGHPLAAGAG